MSVEDMGPGLAPTGTAFPEATAGSSPGHCRGRSGPVSCPLPPQSGWSEIGTIGAGATCARTTHTGGTVAESMLAQFMKFLKETNALALAIDLNWDALHRQSAELFYIADARTASAA